MSFFDTEFCEAVAEARPVGNGGTDFERFPRYYSRIGCEQWKFGLQMMIEPLLLFDGIVIEDRSIMLLIDSNYSYRSDELLILVLGRSAVWGQGKPKSF